jgi:pSer/pThr/pTyr-binding forkhead associated (FHA) protein
MHEDAGKRRRRRLLLLCPRYRVTLAPFPEAISAAAPDETRSAGDALFRAVRGDANVVLRVEDLARRVLREQPLDRPVLTIGRGADNDLWLNHDRVLPRHALLVWLDGGVFFTALDPKAELLGVQGPVTSGWWTSNLCLRIGAFRLRLLGLKTVPPEVDPLAPSRSLAAELPRLELHFVGSARPWPVTRPVTLIGRSPVCKIRLEHGSVLPVQAVLLRTAGRLWLVNLGKEGDVLVNDVPADAAQLEVGDRLRIGDFRAEVDAAGEWPSKNDVQREDRALARPRPADETLLRDFADQHQKLLDTHLYALHDLERLARQITDPQQLKTVLDVLHRTARAIGQDDGAPQREPDRGESNRPTET